MDTETEEILHVKNTPEENARTAPELKLYRPKINYVIAAVYFVMHFVVGFGITGLIGLGYADGFVNVMRWSVGYFWIATLALFVITLRFTAMWFVRLYQRYAKAEVRLRCCMTPSCSQYAYLALRKYGVIVGTVKTIKRLRRCHPPGGVDYP